jgi:metallophosphoesterase superfamily enzyme
LLPVLALHAVRRLAVAGDLFEDEPGDELVEEFLHWLSDARLEMAGLAPGNHDRGRERLAAQLPVFEDGLVLGDWLVLHGDGALPTGRVIHGHVHPCFRLGPTINAPCYLVAKNRIVLPAFSPDAAGVNVVHEPAWGNYQCVVSTGDKLLDFGELKQMQRVSS